MVIRHTNTDLLTCKICGRTFKLNRATLQHIRYSHKLTAKQYYDKFYKTKSEDICLKCGNPTKFFNMAIGYRQYCSVACGVSSSMSIQKAKETLLQKYGVSHNFQIPGVMEARAEKWLQKYGVENIAQLDEIRQKKLQTNMSRYGAHNSSCSTKVRNKISNSVKSDSCQTQIKQTCEKYYGTSTNIRSSIYRCDDDLNKVLSNLSNIETFYNITHIHKICKLFGSSWYTKKLVPTISVNGNTYIRNSDIPIVKQHFIQSNLYKINSYRIMSLLQHSNIDFICNDRKNISPFELDWYVPQLKLAIEYNGNYWHSIEKGVPKDYHLKKSLLCRDNNIRLIHIYEFEDINMQLYLLQNLINGTDLYNKNDFNKNNLIDIQYAKAVCVYQNKYTIYGAGVLYKTEYERNS